MVKLFNHEWSKADLLRRVGHMQQLSGIRLLEAGDGKARGSRMLEVRTGSGLRFLVNADRALDLSSCDFRGIPLSWYSAAGDVHPAYYESQGLGWLRSFAGGLMTTCGLDHFGPPCQDGDLSFGLHGRVSNIPASQMGYSATWKEEDYVLEIAGEVRQAALFGENLVLRRRISSILGSNHICIQDTIVNEGYEPTPHMLLYHFNLGFPLVSEAARLSLTAESTLPRDAVAQSGLAEWDQFQTPTPGYQEQVFIHRLLCDEAGLSTIQFENPQLRLGLRWTFGTANLPYLIEWKMMGEGAYVVGIEPANCAGVGGRAAARAQGQLPELAAGESRDYVIDLEVVQLEYPQGEHHDG